MRGGIDWLGLRIGEPFNTRLEPRFVRPSLPSLALLLQFIAAEIDLRLPRGFHRHETVGAPTRWIPCLPPMQRFFPIFLFEVVLAEKLMCFVLRITRVHQV